MDVSRFGSWRLTDISKRREGPLKAAINFSFRFTLAKRAMGNDFSSGNNLAIQTDRPFYLSGEASGDLVQGFVLLNCVSPFRCDQVSCVRKSISVGQAIRQRITDACAMHEEAGGRGRRMI